MSSLVKMILVVAFAIFVIGFIWAIVTAIKRGDEVTQTPADQNPPIEQPTSTPAPTPTSEPQPSTPVESDGKSVPTKPQRRTTTVHRSIPTEVTQAGEEVHTEAGGAWATAGIDQYGNAYAEAHAF